MRRFLPPLPGRTRSTPAQSEHHASTVDFRTSCRHPPLLAAAITPASCLLGQRRSAAPLPQQRRQQPAAPDNRPGSVPGSTAADSPGVRSGSNGLCVLCIVAPFVNCRFSADCPPHHVYVSIALTRTATVPPEYARPPPSLSTQRGYTP
jgi:hypothetical protein